MTASSLITDANSCLSGGPQLQRSCSINNDSYAHLPTSPMSFTSNISASSVMDGSSIIQQNPQQKQMPNQSSSSSMVKPIMQDSRMSYPRKRPRVNMGQGDPWQQQVFQPMLQRHQHPHFLAMMQQQRLAQLERQQILQSFPQSQQVQTGPRPNPPTSLQVASSVRHPSENGLCARRLMQLIHQQNNQRADNSISYWRNFVTEYFAPKAKKRWCFAMHNAAGNHAFGGFPLTAMDTWQCSICSSKAGKGFDATYEVLPRLYQTKFGHGVINELLYMDMPCETRLPSGIMVLEYAKAVQETVHEQLRVVREGGLRILFTPDLKILCWEFCVRHHEELLPHRIIDHQVSPLLQVAQKYQAAVNKSVSARVSVQFLQASLDMFLAASRQLARNLDLQSLNDLGFSKRYVRCLQISEAVNSMKDLMDFSQAENMGPIDSLKNYPQRAGEMLEAQKLSEQIDTVQNPPDEQNQLNSNLNRHSVLGSHAENIHPATFYPINTPQTALPLPSISHHYLQRNSAKSRSSANLAFPNNYNHPINNQSSIQANQQFQQHMIHQLLQDMLNEGAPQQSTTAPVVEVNNFDGGKVNNFGSGTAEISGDVNRKMQNESSALKPANNGYNSCVSSNSCTENQDVFENLNLPELEFDNIWEEFTD